MELYVVAPDRDPPVTTELDYSQDGSDSEPLGPGGELRQARVSSGVSLDDAQRATRISRRYLEALESDDYDALPAPVFARGFLRSYAQFLGLDATAISSSFLGEASSPDVLPDPRAVGPRVEVGRRQHDRRRADPNLFDPYRAPNTESDTHLAPIPHVDTRAPSVRLGPWLVAGFVVLVVLAGVVAVVTLGDDEPAASPLPPPPGVAVGSELPVASEAAAQEQATINLNTMPDFRPRTIEDAFTILLRAGLSFAVIEVFDAATPAGTILEQVPLSGDTLDTTTTVTLVVSLGPTPVEPAPGTNGATQDTETAPAIPGATDTTDPTVDSTDTSAEDGG